NARAFFVLQILYINPAQNTMVPPPLTREDLIAIRDGNKRNAVIRLLLHEIRRLRVVALKARQYVDCVDTQAEHTHLVRMGLLDALANEPCVLEHEQTKAGLREGMV